MDRAMKEAAGRLENLIRDERRQRRYIADYETKTAEKEEFLAWAERALHDAADGLPLDSEIVVRMAILEVREDLRRAASSRIAEMDELEGVLEAIAEAKAELEALRNVQEPKETSPE